MCVNRPFKTPTHYHPAVKFGVPACKCVNPRGGGEVWRICCHVDLTETEGRGGEQTDNDCSVSVQQQTTTSVQGSLRPQPTTTSVNTQHKHGVTRRNAQWRCCWAVSCALQCLTWASIPMWHSSSGSLTKKQQHLLPLPPPLSSHLTGDESLSVSFSHSLVHMQPTEPSVHSCNSVLAAERLFSSKLSPPLLNRMTQ